MAISGRTISRLAAPFEGGAGPSHSTIENIWLAEDASDYLPEEGNKADRVRGGLKALRDGRAAGSLGPQVEPDPEKLLRVAEELAERLVASAHVKEEEVSEAFGKLPKAAAASPARSNDSRSVSPSSSTSAVSNTAPIFVVHGHDHGLLHQTVRVLEKATSRRVVVLHEQANAGRTLLEKFEAHASGAAFAVVLLTPDDHGGAQGDNVQRARARQNVIFELGFFFGRLGRDRVAVLLAPDVEQPSDIEGLLYIQVDPAGSWKYSLARELSASSIEVQLSEIP